MLLTWIFSNINRYFRAHFWEIRVKLEFSREIIKWWGNCWPPTVRWFSLAYRFLGLSSPARTSVVLLGGPNEEDREKRASRDKFILSHLFSQVRTRKLRGQTNRSKRLVWSDEEKSGPYIFRNNSTKCSKKRPKIHRTIKLFYSQISGKLLFFPQ